ncbi:MAG: MFS transporter [Candidatus Nezhaarchaeales archaeon]
MDKGRESLEWGMVAVSTSLGQALTAAVGGTLTEKYGFETVFTVAGILIVVSSIIPLSIHKELASLKR